MYQFSNILGHKNQISGLKRAVEMQRVAHAYLFHGPQGVGKKTTARSFAALMLCDHSREGDACGSCISCRQVINNNHPDFFQITPRGASIKIEQIRDIQKKVIYKPYQNKGQVFILENAELMTIEAANCFLKILEEPPGQTVFILTTAKPDLLPSTVISRCQPLAFKELTLTEIIAGMVKLAGISEEEARLPAIMARGSLGKALTYITDNSPVNLRDRMITLAKVIRRGIISNLLDEVPVLAEDKYKAWETVEMLSMWYRDLLIWQAGRNENLLFNKDKLNIISAEAEHYTTETLVYALEQLEAAKDNLQSNSNPRLVLDVVLLGLTRLGEGGSAYAL